jgi:hypothetical protein
MSNFSLSQVNVPSVFDPLLPYGSQTISVRSIDALFRRKTTIAKGVTTVIRTVQFRPKARSVMNSVDVPTSSLYDNIGGYDLPLQINQGVIGVSVPEWKIKHPLASEENVEVYGDCMQINSPRDVVFYTIGNPRCETISKPSQYEFGMLNSFPADFSASKIASCIEDGMTGSCLWVIKRTLDQGVSTILFAVTPERVLRDIKIFDKSVTDVNSLYNAFKQIRPYNVQPNNCIQNIFPRVEVVNGKLDNTTIINGEDWKTKKGIKSAAGQTLTWSWAIGLFNDTDNNGRFSTIIGPSIYDIKRSDWVFISWDDFTTGFTLVDSDTEKARIDVDTKTIYYSSKRRTVISLQMRQAQTDKGEDYSGYTNIPNDICQNSFYNDSLVCFLKNTYIQQA